MNAHAPASLPGSRRCPRRVACLVVGAVLWALCGSGAAGQPSAGSVYLRPAVEPAGSTPSTPVRDSVPEPLPATPQPAVQPERILLGSLAALGQVESFTAGLRQKVRIGDRVLVGAGRYLQSGLGEDQRFRFESRLQCDTEAFELTEVCDGVFCWSCRRQGSEAPVVQRLDVRRVRDRLAQVAPGAPGDAAAHLGGLHRTLWLVREWFQFVSADVTEAADGPAWALEGRWIPERLATILPDLAEATRRADPIQPGELPDGVPWAVRITVGRRDLLPRSLEWLAIPGPRPVTTGTAEPIAVLELHDLEVNRPVDAAAFLYRPAAEGLMDVTEQHLLTIQPQRP